jgi:hypothetical protein
VRLGGLLIYICLRTEDAAQPKVPSVQEFCMRCGHKVWVDPVGYAMAVSMDEGNPEIRCAQCVTALIGSQQYPQKGSN